MAALSLQPDLSEVPLLRAVKQTALLMGRAAAASVGYFQEQNKAQF